MPAVEHIDQLIELADPKFIEQAYQIFLGRAPDAEGRRYYSDLLDLGHLKIDLIAQIAASTEAKERYVSLTGLSEFLDAKNRISGEISHIDQLLEFGGAVFIEYAFHHILSRKPDPEGLRYYINRLQLGYNKTSVILQIANSTENNNNNFDAAGLKNLNEKNKRENHWLFGIFSRANKVERQLNRMESELMSLTVNIQNYKYGIQHQNLDFMKIAESRTISVNHLGTTAPLTGDTTEITTLSNGVTHNYSKLTPRARYVLNSLTKFVKR
jgi:Domain of unknown function (DUF4214)